jgi:hypothetical protein
METWKEFEDAFRKRTEGGHSVVVATKDDNTYVVRYYQTLGMKIYMFDENMKIIGDVKLSDVQSVGV